MILVSGNAFEIQVNMGCFDTVRASRNDTQRLFPTLHITYWPFQKFVARRQAQVP